MAATAEALPPLPLPATDPIPDPDQYVLLHRAGWDDYERLLALRGESAVPRMTFLDGELELMTPSTTHEGDKTTLARLLEAWAEEAGIELEGYGSWTLKDKAKQLGAEADECYLVGPISGELVRPEIAIEVARTSGGIDKLAVYHGLGVAEVWIWQQRRLRIDERHADGYREVARSPRLPTLDPQLLVDCMSAPSQTAAVRALRARMRA